MNGAELKFAIGLSSALTSAIVGALGGYDSLLRTLIVLVALDVATGVSLAVLRGNLSARIAWRGGLRKVGVFLAVGLATALDGLVIVGDAAGPAVVRGLVCGYYVATEGLSIVENLGLIGLPVPSFLAHALARLRSESDPGERAGAARSARRDESE